MITSAVGRVDCPAWGSSAARRSRVWVGLAGGGRSISAGEAAGDVQDDVAQLGRVVGPVGEEHAAEAHAGQGDRGADLVRQRRVRLGKQADERVHPLAEQMADRKSTRLNSSHMSISYA